MALIAETKEIIVEIKKVVITGGPCAGKTSILSFLKQKMEEYGWTVYIVMEAATLLIERQGMLLKNAVRTGNARRIREYQEEIIGCMIENEARMERCARIAEDKFSIIFCDRGVPDNRAYFPRGAEGDEIYERLLEEMHLNPLGARERYDSVIKLTTAALGAEGFYTLENNPARDEPLEVARELDCKVQDAYLGHPHFAEIDNSTGFEAKKLRALQALCRFIGIPAPLEIERKYKVSYPCFTHFPVNYVTIEIEQAYIRSDDPSESVRIRRRSQHQSSTYYLTKKRDIRPGERIEVERMISWREYHDFRERRDLTRGLIRKKRTSFSWMGQYFELDVFENLPFALCLLEIEVAHLSAPINLPPFLKIEEEVTDNPKYYNESLALQIL